MPTITDSTQAANSPSAPHLLTDEALLIRYRDYGDQDAYYELVHRYENELFHYLWRYLHHAGLAEEVFQTAFLRLALHSDRFLPDHRVRPWLYTIATHLAIDALRRANRRRTVSLDTEHGDDATLSDLLVDHTAPPSALVEQQERAQWLQKAIGELPSRLRDPLKLVYFEGIGYAEAAHRLRIPLGTLKSRLHESLLKLSKKTPDGALI